MAIENVKKFFELVKSDEELAREIAKIKDEIQNKGETMDYEQIISKKVIPLAKEHGLDFTMEDFLKYTNSMVQQGELSDDDLLNVSGGMNLRQGLATGLLMLTVGTTGLSLMGNLTVPGGDGSGGAAPTTSYSQSIDNDTEDEEVVDTENDEREDNDFNDEDDVVPAAEGVSMDMLGAGMFDDSESEADTQRGAGESASTNKNTAGGAAKSATATKATAGGGVTTGGAAKSTIAKKTTAGGTGSGAAGGTTTTTATKKDEAVKTEVTEKQEYKKFGKGSLLTYWSTSSYSDIGKHIYGEMDKVGFNIDNFSNKDVAVSQIKDFISGVENASQIGTLDGEFAYGSEEKQQYDKIKTSYDNYTAEVAKKDLAKKVAEEAAKKAAENKAKKAAKEEAAKQSYEKYSSSASWEDAANHVGEALENAGGRQGIKASSLKEFDENLKEVNSRIKTDSDGNLYLDDSYSFNFWGGHKNTNISQERLQMIKTAYDELANLAKK